MSQDDRSNDLLQGQVGNWLPLWSQPVCAEQPISGRNLAYPRNGYALDEEELNAVRQVAISNLETGRAHRVIARMNIAGSADLSSATSSSPAQARIDQEAAWHSYVQRVTDTYIAEHERIAALAANCAVAWETLRSQLVAYARRLLQQKGFCTQFAQDDAEELAQQTCERIYVSTYPYDVPFDHWACTILKNLLQHGLTRSQDILDRQPYMVSIDDLETPESVGAVNLICQSSAQDPHRELEVSEQMSSILTALEDLASGGRRAVVVYTYLVGLSDDEIANTMGRKKAVVQTLRHRALHQLRTLLPGDQ